MDAEVFRPVSFRAAVTRQHAPEFERGHVLHRREREHRRRAAEQVQECFGWSHGGRSGEVKQKLFFRPFDKKKRIEWQSAIYGRREPPPLIVFDGIFLSLL